MAGISAALHFSNGATSKHAVMSKSGIPVGVHTIEGGVRRDQQRVQQGSLRVSEQYRVFQKFVDILKSLYFIQISYISLHFLADINKSYCLSIFRTFV